MGLKFFRNLVTVTIHNVCSFSYGVYSIFVCVTSTPSRSMVSSLITLYFEPSFFTFPKVISAFNCLLAVLPLIFGNAILNSLRVNSALPLITLLDHCHRGQIQVLVGSPLVCCSPIRARIFQF